MRTAVIASLFVVLTAGSAHADAPIAQVSQLRLYSNFWQNLHHFLYVSAWARRPDGPRPPLAMPLPATAVVLAGDEKTTWDAAIRYYDRNIASRDLLFDDDLTHIKVALSDADDT